ncbi:response regulator [Candidatus Poribacteria bacterium]|nr:response regulator [Candidatus Poribacteria bacterium]MBT5710940.1 response regulator [Candidatus Poribacteria bacterium]MBT7805493.1 response regulator [Candidatus Poribacteria bacterium]
MRPVSEQDILEATILIVDDEPANVMLLRQMLEFVGYSNIESTTDSREAVGLYREASPDLLLLDLMMPHVSGFDILQELRGDEDTATLPVIVLTADREAGTRMRALDLGARDFLTKPFDVTELRFRIRNLIEAQLLHRLVDRERHKADNLLSSVLPEPVAQQLKEAGSYPPVRIPDCSVMFVDLTGFSRIADGISPQQLVSELNVCFTFFDRIVTKHHLEKIKTIGDGYMCVGGVLHDLPTHPFDATLAGLEMMRFIQERRRDAEAASRSYWSVRIGIHSGALVAGVLGREKPMFDLWGSTVNMAARVEQSGRDEDGGVYLSQDTHERVGDLFDCEDRGELPIKNMGHAHVFRVTGIRTEYAGGDASLPGEKFDEAVADRVRSRAADLPG